MTPRYQHTRTNNLELRIIVFTFTLVALFMGITWLVLLGTLPQEYVFAGLIPRGDAHFYLNAALAIADSGSPPTLHRPLYPTFLSTLITVLGPEPVYIHLFTALLCALSVSVLIGVIDRIWCKWTASLCLLLLVAFFYRHIAATFMTESLGFILGNLALAMLLSGASNKSPRCYLLGILILHLAFLARPGAIIALVLLVLFSPQILHLGLRGGVKFVTSVVILLVVSSFAVDILHSHVQDAASPLMGNFAHTIYGISKGGAGWYASVLEHPRATPSELYRFAVANIISEPTLFARGIWTYLNEFIVGMPAMFLPTKQLAYLVMISFWIGTALTVRSISSPVSLMLVAYALGMVLSSPFLLDGGSRVYAATVGAFAILAVVPITALVKHLFPVKAILSNQLRSPITTSSSATMTMLIVFMAFIPLFSAMKTSNIPALTVDSSHRCPAGTEFKHLEILASFNARISNETTGWFQFGVVSIESWNKGLTPHSVGLGWTNDADIIRTYPHLTLGWNSYTSRLYRLWSPNELKGIVSICTIARHTGWNRTVERVLEKHIPLSPPG